MMLKEGKNREIRRMLNECGYKVRILRRIKIGNLYDPTLKMGRYRKLTDAEVARLYALAKEESIRHTGHTKDQKMRIWKVKKLRNLTSRLPNL